jgi:hypothetical protein
METFDQIWASSRSNGWSWGYPAILWSGISLLIGLSILRTVWVRRVVKIVTILLLTALATELASLEILEKWRIRREWANANQPLMTPAAQQALTVDGANRTLGPLFYGLQAFTLFVALAAALSFVRRIVKPRPFVVVDQNEEQRAPEAP